MPDSASQTRQARRVGLFLVGLLVAIIVEIAVDWNATFYEITVLRSSLQQKGENYADIMRQAATDAMLGYNWDALDRLSARLFDDEDVVYVRFTDVLGNTIYDRLRVDFGNDFKKTRGTSFRLYYRRVMDRDTRGILTDPVALKQRYEASRHKDIIQKFNDLQMALVRRFSTPKAGPEEVARTLYQDRLAEKDAGPLDKSLSYSVGAVTNEVGDPFGTILIAFRQDRLNSGTRMKLWKGTAITLFFVGLIIFQNISARRSKLRLQALERVLQQAREAVATGEQLPPADSGMQLVRIPMRADVGASLCICREESPGVSVVLLAEPHQRGLDAAFGIVALADAFRRLPLESRPLAELLGTLRDAHEKSPNAIAVEAALLRVDRHHVVGHATADFELWQGERFVEVSVVEMAARPRSFGATFAFKLPREKRVVLSTLRHEVIGSLVGSKKPIAAELADAWDENAYSIQRGDAWLFVVGAPPPEAPKSTAPPAPAAPDEPAEIEMSAEFTGVGTLPTTSMRRPVVAADGSRNTPPDDPDDPDSI